jgi:peptidoglycan-associated lipoprotein
VLTTFRNTRLSATRRAVVFAAAAAAVLTIAGCHKKVKQPPPPPPVANAAPQPTATITAKPDTISPGQTVILSWSTTDANSASIEGIGPVPTAGTRNVGPTESTDYTLTAVGDGGNATATAQDANFLNQHPEIKVVIGGYCDERGSTEYNLALGENRANAAKQSLVSAGVSPTRLRTVSYGKEKQFCSDHSESCWQQNRRAQFAIDK